MPGIICSSQPILMLSLYRDHLMLEGFGAFLSMQGSFNPGAVSAKSCSRDGPSGLRPAQAAIYMNPRTDGFFHYWDVYPKVDVRHASMVLECKDNSQNKKTRQDSGWDAEISVGCCHLWQTCVSLHHQRANMNVGGTNSPRTSRPDILPWKIRPSCALSSSR